MKSIDTRRKFKALLVTPSTRFSPARLVIAIISNRRIQRSFLRGISFLPNLTSRFASLYFIISIDKDENELLALEFIQHYVEVLDQYYGNVAVASFLDE